MSSGLPRLVVLFALLLTAALAACTSDKKPDNTAAGEPGERAAKSGGEGQAEIVSRGSSGSNLAVYSAIADLSLPPAGVTVRGSASALVPAETAKLVVFPSFRSYGPGGPQAMSSQDREAVVEALTKLGIKKEDISVEQSQQFVPFGNMIQVTVPLDKLQTTGEEVINAIEKVTGRSESSGALFGLKDCGAALDRVRRDAFKDVESKAKSLAATASLQLGPVVAVSEGPSYGPYGPAPTDPCDPLPSALKGNPALQPLDAKAEVKVTLDLTVTYSAGSGGTGTGLTASASGFATAKPDEAYLVALVQPGQGQYGPVPLSGRDRERLLKGLTGAGFKRDQIEVVAQSPYGLTVVQVEVAISDVEKLNKAFLTAVEEVVGRAQSSGVRYMYSKCADVQAASRLEAIKAGEARARALAAAAQVSLGGLESIMEAAFAPYGPTVADPCTSDLAAAFASGPYTGIEPFDAEPSFKVETAVRLTYGLAK